MKKYIIFALALIFLLIIVNIVFAADSNENETKTQQEKQVESRPTLRYQYVIPKPWHQQTWFYIVSFTFILVAVFLFLFGPKSIRSFVREKRRNKLIRYIAKKNKQGETSERISSELKELGYRSKYIEDAFYRYKYRKNKKESMLKRHAVFSQISKGLRQFKTLDEIKNNLVSKGHNVEDIAYYFHLYSKEWEDKNTRYELSKENLPKIYRKWKRNSRRKMLLHGIEKGVRCGKDFSQIRENLLNKGYLTKHIDDAIHRYKEYQELLATNKSFIHIRKPIRHKKIHFKKMIKNTIKEGIKQGKSYEEILDELVIRGLRAEKAKPFMKKYYFKYKNQNSE